MQATPSYKPTASRRKTTSETASRPQTRRPEGSAKRTTRKTARAVQFKIAAERGSRVYVAGTFNNWDPTAHPLNHHPQDGVFKAALRLPAGTHQYKYVVNGVWRMDAACPLWAPNEHGTLNSVIRI